MTAAPPAGRRRSAAVVALAACVCALAAWPGAPPAAGSERGGSAADTTPGTALLHGLVTRAESTPLSEARVQVLTAELEQLRSATTSGDGSFRLDSLPSRLVYVAVRARGFVNDIRGPIELGEADTVELHFELRPRKARPDSVTVTLDRKRDPRLASVGFYRRRARTSGHFMTAEEIMESGASTLSAGINQLVSGVEVVRTPAGNGVVLPGGQQTLDDRCYPLVYVDGTQVGRAGPSRRGGGGGVSLDNLVDLDSLSGLEVYASAAEVPGAYSGMESRCGVILLWTETR